MVRPSVVCKHLALTFLYSVLLWLVLPLLYFLLPFPPENSDTATSTLGSGGTYTRVYETEHHWPRYVYRADDYNDLPMYSREGPIDRKYFALNFSLTNDHAGGDAYLTIGGTTLGLHELMEPAATFGTDNLDPPYIIPGGHTINTTVAIGDYSGIALPYFPPGDETMLGQVFEPHSAVIQVVVSAAMETSEAGGSEDAVIQIRSLLVPDLDPSEYALPRRGRLADGGILLVIHVNRENSNSFVSAETPSESWGLSKTFVVRRAVLRVMAPSGLIFYAVLVPACELMSAIVGFVFKWSLALLVLWAVLWLCAGRPSLEILLEALHVIKPNARLQRARLIAVKRREEIILDRTRRKKDFLVTDAWMIWRESKAPVVVITDDNVFHPYKDVEEGQPSAGHLLAGTDSRRIS